MFRLNSTWIVLLSCVFAACSGESANGAGDGSGADAAADLPADVASESGADAFVPVDPHVEKRGDYTVVWLKGTPYEMGKQQGGMLRDVISEAMDFVAADPLLSSIPELAIQLGIYDLLAANTYPDILDECKGMVDGADVDGFSLEYCVILNCGDVLLHFLYVGVPDAPEGPGCSGAVVTGKATKDGRLLHSRNLDWGSMNIDIIYQNPMVFVRQPEGGIPHIYVGFPMNLSAYSGMNAAGIAFGTHAADPIDAGEMSATGRSNVQMTSQMLKSVRTLDEVENFLKTEPRMTAGILVASDGNGGEGAVYDVTATGVGVRSTGDAGLVYGTNHFESDEMKDKDDEGGSGSRKRWDRFGQLLDPDGAETVYGMLDHAALMKVMRDVKDPWTGHEYTMDEIVAAGYDTDGTLGANAPMHFALFEPARGLFWVAAGKPPLHTKPATCFSMDELLGLPNPTPCEPAEL